MQKRLFSLFVLFLFIQPLLHAAEIAPVGTSVRKLQRGFLNVVLSPIEISTELAKEKDHDTFPPSWMLGLGRGSVYMVGRILAGSYEMLTFPLSAPGNYGTVVLPEFEWEHFPQEAGTKK
jgi:putative exosortase-associated protein (TIGR04073 family)